MLRLVLPLLFIAVPLAEIALFVTVGGRIGVFATVAIVVATAMLGTALLRIQGLAVIAEARRAAEEGRVPVGPVVDGICLLAAGLLLLTPDFLTDAIGLALFVPPLRRRLARWAWANLAASGKVHVHPAGRRADGAEAGRRPGGPVIEGDFHVVEPGSDTDGGQRPDRPNRGARTDTPWREPGGHED